MAPNTSKICLDVAVDHRIRRLFKPVSVISTERSNHVSHIETRGWSLKRSPGEIQVTTQLAGPAVKGGIAVVLQQPRRSHPFEEGLDAVIEDSETLYALDDIFSAVSCETLNIRTNITVIDLLPYIFENIASIDDTTLRESFRVSTHTILDKEPSVLLCAGRIWLPNIDKFDSPKGDAFKLESIGIGSQFGNTPKLPVTVKIRHGERGPIAIRRVNAFHPSYAMNYHPYVSRLRQLQILVGVEACARLREDWEEEEWMSELRRRCQDNSGAWPEPLSQSSQPQSPAESTTRDSSSKYLPDYLELYSRKLTSIHDRVYSLISETIPTLKSPTVHYKPLLASGLSENCNDASLILRQMFRLELEGWPDSVAWKNNAALEEAAYGTWRFTENLLKVVEPCKDTKFAKIIEEGRRYLLKSITSGRGSRLQYELDFNQAGDAFLEFATDIETLLLNLLLVEQKTLYALGEEEILSSKMEGMTLVSATH